MVRPRNFLYSPMKAKLVDINHYHHPSCSSPHLVNVPAPELVSLGLLVLVVLTLTAVAIMDVPLPPDQIHW